MQPFSMPPSPFRSVPALAVLVLAAAGVAQAPLVPWVLTARAMH